MKKAPQLTTDDALIQEFLARAGMFIAGKTKPPNPELGLSDNQWNNMLIKDENAVRDVTPTNGM